MFYFPLGRAPSRAGFCLNMLPESAEVARKTPARINQNILPTPQTSKVSSLHLFQLDPSPPNHDYARWIFLVSAKINDFGRVGGALALARAIMHANDFDIRIVALQTGKPGRARTPSPFDLFFELFLDLALRYLLQRRLALYDFSVDSITALFSYAVFDTHLQTTDKFTGLFYRQVLDRTFLKGHR